MISYRNETAESLLSTDEHALVVSRLNELLCAVCDYAHDRCAQIMSAQARDSWVDRATTTQVCDLARLIDNFVDSCEKVCGKPSSALRSAFKVQVSIELGFYIPVVFRSLLYL